jgi:hypothetical protein
LISDVSSRSNASFCPSANHFRFTPINGHRQTGPVDPFRAKLRHGDASCDYRVGGREQREYAGFLIPWRRVISRFPNCGRSEFAEDDGDCGEFNGYCSGVTRRAYARIRGHHTNTDAPPNEQAGTAISEQPLVARVIGSLLDK